MLNLVFFCAVGALASAAPYSSDPIFFGQACPYTWSPDCSNIPSQSPECVGVSYGECVKIASSPHFNYYHKYLYNQYTKKITFQRYTDASCYEKDPEWSHPAPTGYSGECFGPIERETANVPAYAVITVF